MSFLDVLKNIGHGVKTVAVKIAHGFEAIFGKQAADQFGQSALAMLKSDLGKIVVAEVEALAGATDMSGVQKAAAAQSAILKQAEAQGIATSKSIVNMLIELAVQFISGNLQALPTK